MKGLFVLLAMIATVSAKLCPQEEDVEELLSHEDCNKFYKCTYGQPVEQDCPAGLYFSIELGQCEWPENVDCGYRNVLGDREEKEQGIEEAKTVYIPEQVPEQVGLEVESEECVPDEDNVEPEEIAIHENGCPVDRSVHKLLPHEDNCSLFYYCVDGEKVLTKCADSLHFNNELQVCDWPRDAGCAVSANKHLSGRRAFRQSY